MSFWTNKVNFLIELACSQNPELKKQMKLCDKGGRPRIEEEQLELLKTNWPKLYKPISNSQLVEVLHICVCFLADMTQSKEKNIS